MRTHFKEIDVFNAVSPADRAAGAVNGNTFDQLASSRPEYSDAKMVVQTGAVSGTPDSFTVDCKLQHRDPNGSWADVSPAVAITAITAADSVASVAFQPDALKQEIRAVLTPAFVNGTTPKVVCGVTFFLGRRKDYP